MSDGRQGAANAPNPTAVERINDRELAITRIFDAPVHMVFRAWSEPDLFKRWWFPESVEGIALISCEMDMRTGGTYKLEFSTGGPDTVAFYGKYLEIIPDQRIVWTNSEAEEGAVTTVSFEPLGDKTRVTFHELYPSSEALEEALQGSAIALPEQLDQLADMLLGARS